MKNLIKLLFIIPVFVMFNCGGDDDSDNDGNNNNTGDDNILVVGAAEYNMSSGVLVDYGNTWGECGDVNIDLSFASPGINLSNCEDESGSNGQYVYFEMWTSEMGHLDDGTYTLGTSDCSGDITYSFYELNYDADSDNWTGVDIANMSVTVVRNGSNYQISWMGEDVNGTAVTGSYEGSLVYCDVSDEDLDSNNSSKRRSKK